MELEKMIGEVWSNRELLNNETYLGAIRNVIDKIDEGSLRVAEPVGKSMPDGQSANSWKVNEWVKQAILLYFGIQKMETYTLPPFEFYDKMK
jgi:2,3,4,5-tetrahydropyridine-2-carboxylate N-succinyltransferase